jgi:group I intron endonuclease
MAYLKKISGIYTILNSCTKKYYVGYSCDVFARINEHKFLLRSGAHYNAYLQGSFNKWGEGSFQFELLDEYNKEILPAMEHYWATILDSCNREFGYNVRPTHPENTNLVSAATRINISNAKKGCKPWMKGRSHKPESIEKIKESLKGRIGSRKGAILSQETKNRMSLAKKGCRYRLGKKHTEESKLKMSLTKRLLKTKLS